MRGVYINSESKVWLYLKNKIERLLAPVLSQSPEISEMPNMDGLETLHSLKHI